MTTPPPSRAQQLFDEWVDAREAGAPAPPPEDFCRQHPEHREELQRLVAEWQELQDFGGQLRAEFGAPEPSDPSALAHQSEQLEALRQRQSEGRHYEERGEVGRGGMGVVHRVHDRDLQRDLAMKVLRRRQDHDSSGRLGNDVTRFLQEAQITGQLDHPGVVAVHDLGINPEGDVYFTMSLVKGRNLSEIFQRAWAETDGWNQTRVVSALLKVCETLAYAHSKLVVHRDLKPSNVMVGRFGEVYVMDWGLARSSAGPVADPVSATDSVDIRTVRTPKGRDDSSSPWLTRAGSVLGTPAYMAPEQAQGQVREVGPQSDVYSLGAMLYELLAGHPPYLREGEEASAHQVLERIRRGAPASLDEVADHAPPELQAIVEKAMARDPDDRYQGTMEMAQDLHAYLENRVVRSYETGPVAELRKWIRRNRATAALLVVTLVVSVGSLGLLLFMEIQNSKDLQAERDISNGIAINLADANQALEESNQALVEAREKAEANAASLNRVVNWLEDMFQAGTPARAGDYNTSARDLLVSAAQELWHGHLEDRQVATRLHYAVGSLFHHLGDEEQAERHLRAALEACLEHRGAAHATTLQIQNLLTSVLFESGQEQQAVSLLQSVEDILSTRMDVPPVTRATFLVNRAAARIEDGPLEGSLDQAEEDLHQAITLLEDLGIRELHGLLSARSTLALLYSRQGRYGDSEELLRSNLDAALAGLGENHPKTAGLYTRLGEHLRTQSQFDDSEEALSRAVELNLRLLGPGHRETLFSRRSLGALQAQVGRLEEARATLRATVEEARRSLNPGDPLLADVRRLLGGVLTNTGELADAESLLRENLERLREDLGPDDPNLVPHLYQLGRLCKMQNRFDTAIELLTDALRLRRGTGNEWNVSLINILNELGYCCLLTGDADAADPLFTEALDLSQDTLGPTSQFTIRATIGLANLRKVQQQSGEAELLFDEALEMAREHLPQMHPIHAMALFHFIDFLKEEEQWEEAVELAEELVEASPPSSRGRYEQLLEELRQLRDGDG